MAASRSAGNFVAEDPNRFEGSRQSDSGRSADLEVGAVAVAASASGLVAPALEQRRMYLLILRGPNK